MQQIVEFAANHALLSGGFVAVLLLLLFTEVQRRAQGFKTLASVDAVNFMNQEGATVIDLSATVDFEKGHIIGARNLAVSRLKDPDSEVRKLLDKPLLLVCKTGQASAQAASGLLKLGATHVAVLKGGMAQWVSDQYPVTRD